MVLSSGFRREAEELAENIRAEIGVGNIAALDPMSLLQQLEVPAVSLTQLAAVNDGKDPLLSKAISFLLDDEASSLSAVTVFGPSGRRMIVFNEAHSEGRQNSDLLHEASHALLLHPPSQAIDALGCRAWNGEIEEEAQFLAGTLLVPGKAVRYAAKAGWSRESVAKRFGCSIQMVSWRDNVAGGKRLRGRPIS
ncbi:ImmA/IrrE family metallo-endopeptidase [Aeromicrobium sp. CF3.5]|uniref:ImmA/IrrE family metallo-endopeptidase n=1 Tax=Aeromicrobium sp. CF3.5 TaxID=3373078 RepID=UPI003EE73C54